MRPEDLDDLFRANSERASFEPRPEDWEQLLMRIEQDERDQQHFPWMSLFWIGLFVSLIGFGVLRLWQMAKSAPAAETTAAGDPHPPATNAVASAAATTDAWQLSFLSPTHADTAFAKTLHTAPTTATLSSAQQSLDKPAVTATLPSAQQSRDKPAVTVTSSAPQQSRDRQAVTAEAKPTSSTAAKPAAATSSPTSGEPTRLTPLAASVADHDLQRTASLPGSTLPPADQAAVAERPRTSALDTAAGFDASPLPTPPMRPVQSGATVVLPRAAPLAGVTEVARPRRLAIAPALEGQLSQVDMAGPLRSSSLGGVIVGYGLSDRWQLYSGVLYGHKRYAAAAEQVGLSPQLFLDERLPAQTNGNCSVLTLPLGVNYYLGSHTRQRWFVGGSVNNVIVMRDYMTFAYADQQPGQLLAMDKRDRKTYLLSSIRANFGYEIDLARHFGLRLAPYVEIPTMSLSFTQTTLYSAGLQVAMPVRW